MEDMVGLTLACLNIKKLVKMMVGKTYYLIQIPQYYWIVRELSVNIKRQTSFLMFVFILKGNSIEFSFLEINLT